MDPGICDKVVLATSLEVTMDQDSVLDLEATAGTF